MEDIQLMPLRIPMGFAVCYNQFYDIEPVKSQEDEDFLENWGYFTEDILQIAKMDLKNGDWHIAKECLILDLGWYPDSNPEGTYRLVLAVVREDDDWDIIKQIESRDRFKMKDIIEKWMSAEA